MINWEAALTRLHNSGMSDAGRWGLSDEQPNLFRDIILGHVRELEAALAAEAEARWEAEEEARRLRRGVEAYLAGDYDNPRSYRPMPCPHGIEYYNECQSCNDAALEAILARPTPR